MAQVVHQCSVLLMWVECILDWIMILLSLGQLSGGGGCITK